MPFCHATLTSLSVVASDGGILDNRTVVCAEQLGDLVLDTGDDLAVEEGNHSGDEQRAEDNGDNNLHTFGDVEVTVFVLESCLSGGLERLCLEVCTGGEITNRLCHNGFSFRFIKYIFVWLKSEDRFIPEHEKFANTFLSLMCDFTGKSFPRDCSHTFLTCLCVQCEG